MQYLTITSEIIDAENRICSEVKVLYERGLLDFFTFEKYLSNLQDTITYYEMIKYTL